MTCSLKTGRYAIMLIICFFTVFFGAASVSALMIELNADELIDGADSIVIGKVQDMKSRWNNERTSIYTEVLISVEEVLKGKDDYQEITIIVPGGEVDGLIQVFSDMPNYSEGESALLFLDTLGRDPVFHAQGGLESASTIPLFTTHGNFQGKFDVPEDKRGYLCLRELRNHVDNIIDSKRLRLNTESYINVEMLVQQDGFIYEGWRWSGDWPMVDFKINHVGGPSDSISAIKNSALTWNDAGAKFTLSYDGTHTRSGAHSQNFINEITWHNLGSTGVVAYVSAWAMYRGSYYEIIECDMIFNSYYNWSANPTTPSKAFDVETVALHEFGHFLCLKDLYHPQYSDHVMYGYVSTGQQKRSLHSGDIAGITYIYGTSDDNQLSYTLTVQVEGQGDIDPPAGDHEYIQGSEVSLVANPESGWQFKKWLLNGTDYTTTSIDLIMDVDKTIKAVFEPLEEITGSIDHVVLEVNDEMVIFTIGAYGSALAAGPGDELYDYMAAGDVPVVRAVRSGDKFIGIGAYGTAFAQEGNTAGAIAAAPALDQETISTYMVFDGFNGDGEPVLIPLYPLYA